MKIETILVRDLEDTLNPIKEITSVMWFSMFDVYRGVIQISENTRMITSPEQTDPFDTYVQKIIGRLLTNDELELANAFMADDVSFH